MRIFVIGYMGVGKTKQSQLLACRLKLPFVDIDDEIERVEGRSISDVFAIEGEVYFRGIEREVLIKLIKRYPSAVFATGGGLPCQSNAMDLLHAVGKTLYLEASTDQIIQRLLSNRSERPLVAERSPQELIEYVTKSLADREPIYQSANVTIALDLDRSISENAEIIRSRMIESLPARAR